MPKDAPFNGEKLTGMFSKLSLCVFFVYALNNCVSLAASMYFRKSEGAIRWYQVPVSERHRY